MFQYAVGRALAARLNVPLKIDLSAFDKYSLHRYGLDKLSIDAEEALTRERPFQYAGFPGRLIRGLRLGRKPRMQIYRERGFRFDASVLTLPDGTYLDGYWQSERYFCDKADLIRQHFVVRTPPSAANIEWLAKIRSVKAISMHVRRGDYASNPSTLDFHGLCSPSYYETAMEVMTERLGSDTEIFVFSDDLKWAKTHLRFLHRTHFVADNDAAQNYEDLRLMSACRHHIIANSTFSWWGAWLCQNPEKIVIAPKHWFREGSHDTSDLIPETWTRL